MAVIESMFCNMWCSNWRCYLSSRMSHMRLWALITLQTQYWEIRGLSRSWNRNTWDYVSHWWCVVQGAGHWSGGVSFADSKTARAGPAFPSKARRGMSDVLWHHCEPSEAASHRCQRLRLCLGKKPRPK